MMRKAFNGSLTLLLLVTVFILTGCANSSSKVASNRGIGSTLGDSDNRSDVAASKEAPQSEDAVEQLIANTDLDTMTPDGSSSKHHKIPREINDAVQKWIYYFNVRNRDWFQRALTRSEKWEASMKNILIGADVPEELFYLALIESGFAERAKSFAGARGIWQFMRGTAKIYGLEVTRSNDERLDPLKATAAAAAYLRDLYNIYGSWYLAIASYNAGEGRIRNAIIKNRERNFWELAGKSALPSETMDYVPKYIAASIIAENPAQYGFVYNGPSSGAAVVDEQVKDILANQDQYGRQFKKSSASARNNKAYTYAYNDSNDTPKSKRYKVRRGDTLSGIADKLRIPMSKLKECNPALKQRQLIAGQRLTTDCTSVEQAAKENASSYMVHVVRRGESLWSISKRYGVRVSEITRWNNLRYKSRIFAGRRLRLFVDPDTRS